MKIIRGFDFKFSKLLAPEDTRWSIFSDQNYKNSDFESEKVAHCLLSDIRIFNKSVAI